jgi:4-amino-4-deoxyprephenate dehydrogenase
MTSPGVAPLFELAVVIGAGMVGQLVSDVVRPGVGELVEVDRDPARGALGWDVRQSPSEEVGSAVRRADLVVFALPQDALDVAIPSVLRVRSGVAKQPVLLVDTASAKSALRRHWDAAPDGVAFLGVNPMFAPDLDPRGRPVLIVEPAPTEGGAGFIRLLAARGMAVVPVADLDTHDRLAAVTQAAVHASVLAFGLAARAAGINADTVVAVAPPPCRTLLRLAARMGDLASEVYDDVQLGNLGSAGARAALATALGEIETALGSGRGVAGAIDDVTIWLGAHRADLAAECVRMFST